MQEGHNKKATTHPAKNPTKDQTLNISHRDILDM